MSNHPTFPKIILIVEDDLSIREVLQESIESEGYSTLLATNGKDALEILKAGARPSLIVLDMMMPIMDGRTFLDLVRNDRNFQDLPVIVVSANASPSQTVGANAFIPKPIDFDYLMKKISELGT